MMEALRLPWGRDDGADSNEVAPSAFRPRKHRHVGPPSRTQASRPTARSSRVRAQAIRSSASVVATPAARTGALGGRRGTVVSDRELARDRVAGRIVAGPQRERHDPDYLLLVSALGLSALGILMVYSTRGVVAARAGNIFDAVSTQLGWAALGLIALLVMMRLDYRYWRMFSVLGFAVAVGLLILVLMPAIPPLIEPKTVGGASRWLSIGGLPAFHPAEMAKLALVVYLAHWLATRGTAVGSFRRGLLPFLVIVGLVVGLVAIEPDLGTTGVLTLTAFVMFFIAGGSIVQLALLVPVGIGMVALLLQLQPYQLQRWTTFLDPFAVADGPGFQTVQAIYALALGGVAGTGLGESRKPGGLLLPNADNDFIFAVVGQELGMAGALLVVGLFLMIAWRGVRIGMNAPDVFGGLLAIGITAWLAFQAFINIGVVINLLPLTGLPLPFLSDGGTSLVVSLAAVGILLSISRETVSRGSDAHEDPGGSRGDRRPHLPGAGRREPAVDPAP